MISHLPLRLAASAIALGAVLPSAPARCQTATLATAAAAVVQMEHVSIVSIGRGSPVVLIPGLSSPRATWDEVAPALAVQRRVVLVQINGFAGDDPRANLKPDVLDGVVADLHAYLAREKLTGAAVVGHSLGGLVALKLAIAHPTDTGRLMIVDAMPFYGRLFGPTATPAMLEPRAAAMRDQMAGTYGKPADPAAGEAVADRLALKPASRVKVRTWVAAADPRVSAEAMYEDLTTDVTAQLHTITVPVTLVLPYNDDLPQAKVDALYRAAYAGTPHLTVVEVPDAAHFVMLDQPARFQQAVETFLHPR